MASARLEITKPPRGQYSRTSEENLYKQNQDAWIKSLKKQPLADQMKSYYNKRLGITTVVPKDWKASNLVNSVPAYFSGSLMSFIGVEFISPEKFMPANRAAMTILLTLAPDIRTVDDIDNLMQRLMDFDFKKQERIHPDGKYIRSMSPVVMKTITVSGFVARQYSFTAGTYKNHYNYVLVPAAKRLLILSFDSPEENTGDVSGAFQKMLTSFSIQEPQLSENDLKKLKGTYYLR